MKVLIADTFPEGGRAALTQAGVDVVYDPGLCDAGLTHAVRSTSADVLVVRGTTVGFGKQYPEFWLNARPEMEPLPANNGSHICLRVRSTDLVDAFHAAGSRRFLDLELTDARRFLEYHPSIARR